MKKKKAGVFLIIILFLLLFSLRMIHPSADPPETLSMSAGEYGDPGGYAFNARNKILFGKWEIDEVNSAFYASPIPALLTYLSFKLFGIGFIQMNAVPILFSCLILFLIFLIMRKILDSSLSLVAISFSLLGMNYLFMMYSRIANRIMPMIFFLVLAFYLALKGFKSKKWYFYAGASVFLAFMTKGVCIYIVGAFFLGLFVYLVLNLGFKKALIPFSYYLAGFAVGFVFWIIFIYIPHGKDLKSISELNVPYLVPPKSLPKVLYYFWIRPSLLLAKAPIISILSGLSFLLLLFKASQKPKRFELGEWIMLFWFMTSVIYFSIIQQRVTRHFIPQIIPMVFLSAWFIRDFLRTDRITKPKTPNLFAGLGLFFWLLFPVSRILKPALERLPTFFSNIWIATSFLVFLSLLVTFLLVLLIRLWPDTFTIPLPSIVKKTCVAAILLAILLFNGRPYTIWAFHPEYKLKSISVDLGRAFDHAVIAGLWAPVVCMENRHRAHEYFPGAFNDSKDFLEKYKITHVFATTFFGEINDYKRNFPEAMQKATLRVKYPIWRGEVLLYELRSSLKSSLQKNQFEAEIHTRRRGMPRYDPESAGQFAVFAKKGRAGFVALVSPQEKIPQGQYRVIFRIKKETRTIKSPNRMARIDIVSPEAKKLLAIKNLTPQNFPTGGEYLEFSLPLHLNKDSKLDIRIYTDGLVSFWVDWIRIQKIRGD